MNPYSLAAKPAPPTNIEDARFAHESEEAFAALLDFYHVRWEYEPRTFTLRHADDGRVIEAFTPDFYLSDLGLYIELTTLKQGLVTEKHRKLRRLRELEAENAKLKRIVADQQLDISALKDLLGRKW